MTIWGIIALVVAFAVIGAAAIWARSLPKRDVSAGHLEDDWSNAIR